MKNLLKNCLLLGTLILVALDGKTQQPLTLEDAITIGLEKNYDVKISRNQSSIEKNNYTIGNAGFLPAVTLQASQSFTNQDVKQEFLDGRTNERNGAASDVLSAGASLSWVLFDGLKMFITYDKLNELRQAGAIDVERSIENTIYNISLAYYRVSWKRISYLL